MADLIARIERGVPPWKQAWIASRSAEIAGGRSLRWFISLSFMVKGGINAPKAQL